MSRVNDENGQARFTRGVMFVMLAGLLAGSFTYCTTASLTRPPQGQFGNGQETLDYVDGLGFTADTGYIASYACTGCSKDVNLMFLPRDHAQNIRWQSKLQQGAPGEVVAQVVNVDNVPFTDGNFTLAPHEVAYVWVGEVTYGGASTRGFGIYRLNDAGYLAGEWSVAPISKIKYCPHPNPGLRHKPAIKDHHTGPGDCAAITVAQGTSERRLASLGISAAYAASAASSTTLAVMGQLWISCSGGCCQVNPT